MKFLVLFFTILLSFSTVQAYEVITFRNDVFVKEEKSKSWIQLSQNHQLQINDEIRTGKKSFIRIRSNDGVISLGQNSHIVLKDQSTKAASNVDLINGYIRAKFSKSTSPTDKIRINTKTATLGIRGTEFGIIFNNGSQKTTALSYNGDVRLKSLGSKNQEYIKEGEFSTTLDGNEDITLSAKMSPSQFKILKKNESLKTRERKENSNIVAKIPDMEKDQAQQVPSQLIGPGYNQLQARFNDPSYLRPGGYIDLNTGIYIEPREDAEYDSLKGVYKVDKDFGGFDPQTGEYIPPLGLILHPLKGFVVASDLLASTTSYIRDKSVNVTKDVIGTVGKASTKVLDTVGDIGSSIEENTGVVGKGVGNSLRYLKGKAVNSVEVASGVVTDTKDYLSEKTVASLDLMADKMNKYFNSGMIKDQSERISKLPYINQLDLQLHNTMTYSGNHPFHFYEYTQNQVKTEALRNDFNFSFQFKRNLFKKLFYRPRAFVKRIDYFSDDLSFKTYERYHYRYGLDLGVMGKIGKSLFQTYFYFDYGDFYREERQKSRYNEYLNDKRFGFSKLIIGSKYVSSKFHYYYTEFESVLYGKGHINNYELTEILNLENRNFINLTYMWSSLNRNSNKNANAHGIKLEYLYNETIKKFNLGAWLQYKEFNDKLVLETRGIEKENQFGLKFNKNFGKFFNTHFKIYNTNYESASPAFSDNSTSFSFGFSSIY